MTATRKDAPDGPTSFTNSEGRFFPELGLNMLYLAEERIWISLQDKKEDQENTLTNNNELIENDGE